LFNRPIFSDEDYSRLGRVPLGVAEAECFYTPDAINVTNKWRQNTANVLTVRITYQKGLKRIVSKFNTHLRHHGVTIILNPEGQKSRSVLESGFSEEFHMCTLYKVVFVDVYLATHKSL